MKSKLKSHDDEVTDFYDKEIRKMGSNHTFLGVISLDSALDKDGNSFLQVFLKECKYIAEKVISHINLSDNLSDFSSSNKPDEE